MCEKIRRFICCLIHEIKHEFGLNKDDLWTRLCEAHEFDLIDKFKKIETDAKNIPHLTVLIPEGGFTKDTALNNLILKWLKDRGTNAVCPITEIQELTDSLKS